MNKTQFENINGQINSLKTSFCDDENITEQLNILHEQFNTAMSAKWSAEDLSNLIKTDSDVLDKGFIYADTALYENIRSIQDQIISCFGC